MTYEDAVKALDLKDPFTKEPIAPCELINILKQDVVLAVERPGSWEGANIQIVLQPHGFFYDQ